jgi:hypothetical protein
MKDVNISLISKFGWKLLSAHNCLWVSLFKTKYFKYENLLTSPLPIGSFIWNGIKSIVLSCDQVLVLFLISQVLFQFGFLPGFLR